MTHVDPDFARILSADKRAERRLFVREIVVLAIVAGIILWRLWFGG